MEQNVRALSTAFFDRYSQDMSWNPTDYLPDKNGPGAVTELEKLEVGLRQSCAVRL